MKIALVYELHAVVPAGPFTSLANFANLFGSSAASCLIIGNNSFIPQLHSPTKRKNSPSSEELSTLWRVLMK